MSLKVFWKWFWWNGILILKIVLASSLYKNIWGRLPFKNIYEVVFHLQKYLWYTKVFLCFKKQCLSKGPSLKLLDSLLQEVCISNWWSLMHCIAFNALYSMHCIQCPVLNALYSMHCIRCIAFYALYSMHCILCIVCYALYSMHCILCIVFYALYSMYCIICSVC
jgi:hypothetical protein